MHGPNVSPHHSPPSELVVAHHAQVVLDTLMSPLHMRLQLAPAVESCSAGVTDVLKRLPVRVGMLGSRVFYQVRTHRERHAAILTNIRPLLSVDSHVLLERVGTSKRFQATLAFKVSLITMFYHHVNSQALNIAVRFPAQIADAGLRFFTKEFETRAFSAASVGEELATVGKLPFAGLAVTLSGAVWVRLGPDLQAEMSLFQVGQKRG